MALGRWMVVLMVGGLLVAGCLGAGEEGFGLGDGETVGDPLTFNTVDRGSHSGHANQGFRSHVIEDAAAWDAFWRQHASIHRPVPPAPAVDFTRQFVAVVLMGEKPTKGYSIEVRHVGDSDRVVRVAYQTEAPGADCMVSQVMTQPYHFVAVDRPERDDQGPLRAAFHHSGDHVRSC